MFGLMQLVCQCLKFLFFILYFVKKYLLYEFSHFDHWYMKVSSKFVHSQYITRKFGGN